MKRKLIYFQCYSMPLHKFLKEKGIEDEFKAKNCVTDNVFYFYLYDKEGKLSQALNEWHDTKPYFNK